MEIRRTFLGYLTFNIFPDLFIGIELRCVWKNVKERVAKQPPIDGCELRKLLIEALERLKSTPEIIMEFFNHPECGFVK